MNILKDRKKRNLETKLPPQNDLPHNRTLPVNLRFHEIIHGKEISNSRQAREGDPCSANYSIIIPTSHHMLMMYAQHAINIKQSPNPQHTVLQRYICFVANLIPKFQMRWCIKMINTQNMKMFSNSFQFLKNLKNQRIQQTVVLSSPTP